MSISRKLQNLFSAAAFAEEGEFDTAREIAAEDSAPVKKRAAAHSPKDARPQAKGVTPSSSKA